MNQEYLDRVIADFIQVKEALPGGVSLNESNFIAIRIIAARITNGCYAGTAVRYTGRYAGKSLAEKLTQEEKNIIVFALGMYAAELPTDPDASDPEELKRLTDIVNKITTG